MEPGIFASQKRVQRPFLIGKTKITMQIGSGQIGIDDDGVVASSRQGQSDHHGDGGLAHTPFASANSNDMWGIFASRFPQIIGETGISWMYSKHIITSFIQNGCIKKHTKINHHKRGSLCIY
jgi:hypothetical protein